MCFSDYPLEIWIQKSPASLDHLTAHLAVGCQDAQIIPAAEISSEINIFRTERQE